MIKIGINASRARSGGAVAHMRGILEAINPADYNISEIYVWSYRELVDALPDKPWLIKFCPEALNGSLAQQLWWEKSKLPDALRGNGCDILLNVDAGSVCRFRPAVTMSRDMLSYEPGEMRRFGYGKAWIRLLVLHYVQNASLRASDGCIFLTKYAGEMIVKSCGKLDNIAYIPHGISESFRVERAQNWPRANERPVRCLYVSNALPYKHQWHVVKAIENLRNRGFNVQLDLVGGGEGAAQKRLEAQIAKSDSQGLFVTQHPFIPKEKLPKFLADADLFIFASSCENMPNTLIEAMAAGLPIACSNRGPMPEILGEGGVYFNPENPESISNAVEELITNDVKRMEIAQRSKELSNQYSWRRCENETFSFLVQTARKTKKSS
nr:glycosyltransferase [Cytophagales bacterium]